MRGVVREVVSVVALAAVVVGVVLLSTSAGGTGLPALGGVLLFGGVVTLRWAWSTS